MLSAVLNLQHLHSISKLDQYVLERLIYLILYGKIVTFNFSLRRFGYSGIDVLFV